jgi:hypothetical protein
MEKKYQVFLLLLIIITVNLSAQDVHYWSETYGTESTLLGGSVIGSVNDLGATYYNPGKLALANDPKFLFSARIIEYKYLGIKPNDVGVEGASKSLLSPAPAFIVYNLLADWLGKHRMAFSILTRHNFDIRLKTRFVGNVDASDVSNEIIYEGNFNEYWGGITWSYPLSDKSKFGIGITNYFVLRSYCIRNSLSLQTADISDTVGIFSGLSEYDYYNAGVLWKLGIAYTFGKIRFGATITTPSVNLFGSGEMDINVYSSGRDADGDQQPDELLISDYQKDLPSKYNSAFAIGLGMYYKFIDLKIHFACEYYADVSKYNVLTTNEFQSQTGGFTLTNHLTHAFKPVFNFGLGLEYFWSEKVTIYGALVTDRSALNTEVSTNHSYIAWDNYHFTTGAALFIEDFELTFGLSFVFAGDDIAIPLIPLSESEDVEFIFQQQSASVTALRLKLILGLAF